MQVTVEKSHADAIADEIAKARKAADLAHLRQRADLLEKKKEEVQKEVDQDFDLVGYAHQWFSEIIRTIKKKNADYTGKDKNPFKNFELIEHVTSGRISAEDAILVRRTDKLARVAGFLGTKELSVVTESIDETLRDDAAYCMLMSAIMHHRKKKEVEKAPLASVNGWYWANGSKAVIARRDGQFVAYIFEEMNRASHISFHRLYSLAIETIEGTLGQRLISCEGEIANPERVMQMISEDYKGQEQ